MKPQISQHSELGGFTVQTKQSLDKSWMGMTCYHYSKWQSLCPSLHHYEIDHCQSVLKVPPPENPFEPTATRPLSGTNLIKTTKQPHVQPIRLTTTNCQYSFLSCTPHNGLAGLCLPHELLILFKKPYQKVYFTLPKKKNIIARGTTLFRIVTFEII